MKADKTSNLSKNTEFISECRHENKYFLMNIDLNRLLINQALYIFS